jgi:hypothetical protein
MRHCYTKTTQLELFEPQGDREPPVVPRWQSLPDQARNRTTDLLVQLLLEHENQHPDVDSTSRTPHQNGEKADV